MKYYYWEIVVTARKSLLALIGVVFAFDSNAQVNFGFILLMVASISHSFCYPFQDKIMNRFEFLSLGASVATFLCGIFTTDAGELGERAAGASVVAFVVNMLYLVIVAVVYYEIQKLDKLQKPESTEPVR